MIDDLIPMTPHLTVGTPYDELLRQTYLGQAGIAGTGPEGATCRECLFWQLPTFKRWVTDKEGRRIRREYHPADHDRDGELRKHRCMRPILGKAKRRFPYSALACRLFERNGNPPAVRIGREKTDAKTSTHSR